MTRNAAERGVALPLVLFTILVLAILIAAGFAALGSERRVNANDESELDAFTLAQTGLETFIAQRATYGFTAAPPAATESTRITLNDGYADVVAKQVRIDPLAGRYGYVVRSHGVNTVRALSGTPQAERTVSEYAVWTPSTMDVLAGWTSISGLHKNGGSSMGSGADQCGKKGPVAGVAVPSNPGYTQSGGSLAPQGSPPVKNVAPTPSQMADSVSIDWAGLSSGAALTPDVTIPGGAWPSFSNPNYWPTIIVNGNYNLPGDGQGTLIITGNLTISGSLTWNGVLLVGGLLTSNGNSSVNGATVTGLNVKLGAILPPNDLGNGIKNFNYHSCNVAKALGQWGQLTAYTNAWVDNWPTY
jgi:Tfp pilus assembly protein PilX